MDLSLHCSLLGAKHHSGFQVILGPQQPSHLLKLPDGQHSTDFYVEGLTFPDANFPGLISLIISLLSTANPVGQRGGRGVPGRRQWPSRGGGGWGPWLL